MRKCALGLGAIGFFLAQSAFADRIDNRQHRQEARIEKGIHSGELSAQETAHLEKEEAHIDRMEEKAKSDGVVTRKEHAKIELAQDHASHSIHHKKHNKH